MWIRLSSSLQSSTRWCRCPPPSLASQVSLCGLPLLSNLHHGKFFLFPSSTPSLPHKNTKTFLWAHWPKNGTFNFSILWDLNNVCHSSEKWSEVPYIQTSFILLNHPSLCQLALSIKSYFSIPSPLLANLHLPILRCLISPSQPIRFLRLSLRPFKSLEPISSRPSTDCPLSLDSTSLSTHLT